MNGDVSVLPHFQAHTLQEPPTLENIPLFHPTDSKHPWICKKEKDIKHSLETTIKIMSGGPTPHMITVGDGGRDEINVKTDRKTQTEKRIKRLDILSRCSIVKGGLSEREAEEKKRLLKLEKNRRAAQISREKKKRYILNLEGRAAMMGKHLVALELENNQLRAILLSLSKRSKARRASQAAATQTQSTLKVESVDD